jgi:hypothetical protein
MGTLAGELGLGESKFRRGDIHCGTLYTYFVADPLWLYLELFEIEYFSVGEPELLDEGDIHRDPGVGLLAYKVHIDALYRKFETNITRNETARPRSQVLHHL